MGSTFGGTPKRLRRSRPAQNRSILIGGSITVLVAAALAPLLGTVVDTTVKGEQVLVSFGLREATNLIAALVAVLVLTLMTRLIRTRISTLRTIAWISGLTVLTFAVVRFGLQVVVRVVDLAAQAQWVGPELLWAALLWPILFTVLALVGQREQIIDAQTVLLDEARRALQDDHEELRSRVFDHLHGTVTSGLVVSRVRLNDIAADLDDGAVADQVRSIAADLQRLHELEVRRLAHVMVASGLDTSLDEALHQLAASCEGLCEVSVEIDEHYGRVDRAVDADSRAALRLTIYRIVEECLSNALRHAHADHVHVAVSAAQSGRGTDVHVAVTSDGDVPDRTVDPGVGLRVMRARAAAYDGDVQAGVVDGRFVVQADLSVSG